MDLLAAVAGEYTVELIIEELDLNGDLLSQTIEVKLAITNAESLGIDGDIQGQGGDQGNISGSQDNQLDGGQGTLSD